MSLKNILQELGNAQPEAYEKQGDRRQMLKSFGSKVAVAALPIAIASMFKKTYGRTTTTTVVDVLNYALELEFFEYNYYHTANNTGVFSPSPLIPTADRPGFAAIEAQEKAHIYDLRLIINFLGGTIYTPTGYTGNSFSGDPYSPSSFDFTKGGYYPVFSDYTTFLYMAQTFEDLKVKAGLGILDGLNANVQDSLKVMMQINSTEARHASFIRLLRRGYGASEYPKPWITNNIPPTIAEQPFYLGEDVTNQYGVDLTNVMGTAGTALPQTVVTEAFDEPFDQATVMSLLQPYIL